MYICVCAYKYTHMHIHKHTCAHTHVHTHMCTHTRTHTHVHKYTPMHTCAYMHVTRPLQLLNIKKFVQTRGKKGVASKGPPLLLPDILLEVEDLVFKLCDDPFEVKLRTNYEVGSGSECMYMYIA